MEWLVDGLNVIGSRPDGWWRDRRGARARLVGDLQAFLEERAERGTVVFDGRPSPGEGDREPGHRLRVEFAPGGPNAADRRIAALAAEHADPSALRVVTSDAALARSVRAAGATVVAAGAFRRMLEVR